MRVQHIPCGEFANESERIAVERLKSEISRLPGDANWVVLSNVPHAVTTQAVPDDVDIIVVGPSGLHVIEVKHWDDTYVSSLEHTVVTHEADKLANKVRRIASKLKKGNCDAGFLTGKFLLTRGSTARAVKRNALHGSRFFGLKDCKDLLDFQLHNTLTTDQVVRICSLLQPLTKVALRGEVRNIANTRNLERVGRGDERFHRVYRGEHIRTRDKIVLHLYDLSATDDSHAEDLARRHAESLQILQKSIHVPRLMDSFQEVPHYPGELMYFSIVDPCAPTLEHRVEDARWDIPSRISFAIKTLKALADLHSTQLRDAQFVHRHISPRSLLVGTNDQPIFTDFDLARISGTKSLSPGATLEKEVLEYASPEVVQSGIGAADQRSDIYSLCKTLLSLFSGQDDPQANAAAAKLSRGLTDEPRDRPTLADIVHSLEQNDESESAGFSAPSCNVPARYWSEGDIVTFNNHQYRIATRIGSGSFGSTFKVIQIEDGQDVGIFAAKVMFESASGERSLTAYRRVRSHTDKPHLATVFELAKTWEDNRFVSLMKWVDGQPLQNWTGLVELYAEELGETPLAVIARWIESCCIGLRSLHLAGLVHGDISPKNILEHAGDVSLVDYDLVSVQGETIWSPGTVLYSPPEHSIGRPTHCSHDVYALAATLFHVLFEREPFWFDGQKLPEMGLNWERIIRESWGWIPDFLDKSTSPEAAERFTNAMEAIKWIRCRSEARDSTGGVPFAVEPVDLLGTAEDGQSVENGESTSNEAKTPNRVPWLADLLSSYAGSPRGGIETRGLDSTFADLTYVETALESSLFEEIKNRQIQLVILCGNAGDGKTAFLQHLAVRLGLEKQLSSNRVAKGHAFGMPVKINLDGAASYRGSTADELLNDLFEPFHLGRASDPRIHLVAVNDGRLLQWAESYEAGHKPTPLTSWIIETLLGELSSDAAMDHIRIINLNQRSLVGDMRGVQSPSADTESWRPSTEFFNKLLERMIGGDHADEIWLPCQSCSAATRCTAWNSISTLRQSDPEGQKTAANVREGLADALQAVHQRGQVHVTTRELRGALSYIFFGVHYCDDLHSTPELVPSRYWDRAFAADSSYRQGELLAELQRLDPAYGANPAIDRYLRSRDPLTDSRYPSKYPEIDDLGSKRRRAYFEWIPERVTCISSEAVPIRLFQSENLQKFREVAILSDRSKRELTMQLCKGISRLEQLPYRVLRRPAVVPLKVMPRTPVETTFWIEKPLDHSSLELDETGKHAGVEWLANGLILRYRYRSGRIEELRLSSDLFGVLLDLADGYQIMDSANDDVFTNLSIFTQRLAQEDEREVFAWNPSQPSDIFRLGIRRRAELQQMYFEKVQEAGNNSWEGADV